MNIEKLRQLIKERINLHPEDPTISSYWEQEADILSANVEESIHFFRDECTDEEFSWLSEVFDDIIDRTKSVELISVWEMRLQTISNEEDRNSIETDINYAKLKLK